MASKFNFGAFNSPSTPNKGKASLFSAPSTTPAGPPPSHLMDLSTTPAGPPPASSKLFGSSYIASNNTFGRKGTPGRKGFTVPESSPPPYEDDEDDDDDDADAPGELVSPDKSLFLGSSIGASPRGLKRSRNGQVREQQDSGYRDIARAFARDAGPAHRIEEPDEVVLGTEEVLVGLDVATQQQRLEASDGREGTITNAVAGLSRLWSQHSTTKTLSGGIGPEAEDSMTKATYLSTLLLQLHSPYTTKPKSNRPTQRFTLTTPSQQQSSSIPLPRALLDWLDTHHTPIPDDFNEVHLHQPSPSAHSGFIDLLGADLIRGRFTRVIRLLKDAGWENAESASEDMGRQVRGYSGKQLANTEEVVAKCIRVLEACPVVTDDNWDVAGPEWAVFRQRTRHALRDLDAFATANDDDDDDDNTPARAQSNMFTTINSMSAATARAENRVPPSIYENLKMIYAVLLGGNGILDFAQDWVEASILLTVWWDGEESNPALDASMAGLNVSRSAFRKSARGGAGTREVDVAPLGAYRRRLAEMYHVITTEIDEPNFKPDTLDPVQVGLACVFEDGIEAVVGMLNTWSCTVSTALVEVAALGGWLPVPEGKPKSRGLLGGEFSSEDLMVLSHGLGARQTSGGAEGIDRDEVLTSYSDLLASRDHFATADGKVKKEGWELAIAVLGRLDDTDAAQDRIVQVLERLEINDEQRVEKVLNECTAMGFGELGRAIAERYAVTLASQSPSPYGSALIYYARAHANKKLKETLALLISLCLLHSASMPPQQALDAQLASLLSRERAALVELARVDSEAAESLGKALSGYAMLRRFYELRDQSTSSSSASSGPVVMRKRQAAQALIAVIESGSDCIRGGLFDPEVESVVPVDGLLALLGETLPLMGQSIRVLEMKHVSGLMAVIEDFEQVSGRVKDGAVELLKAAMKVYRDGVDAGGRMLKSKSGINITSASGMLSGSESWEQLAESSWSMLQSAESSGVSKGKRVEVQRGWDWRQGLDAVVGVEHIGSREVLMLLRVALAREVARSWGGGGC